MTSKESAQTLPLASPSSSTSSHSSKSSSRSTKSFSKKPCSKSHFKICPHSNSQIIHYAPSTEKEAGFRALILRDILTKDGDLKLVEPFAIDRNVVENCLGKQCWSTEPLVFIQTCPPGSILEEYNSCQPRFVMSATAYLEWLHYMSGNHIKNYNNMVHYMRRIRGPETVALSSSVYIFGGADLQVTQEMDVETNCTIEVKFIWKYDQANPKMYFSMVGVGSELQLPLEVPFESFSYLQSGIKRIKEEMKNYKRRPKFKRSKQSVNGSRS